MAKVLVFLDEPAFLLGDGETLAGEGVEGDFGGVADVT
jgi:hypothetical protein